MKTRSRKRISRNSFTGGNAIESVIDSHQGYRCGGNYDLIACGWSLGQLTVVAARLFGLARATGHVGTTAGFFRQSCGRHSGVRGQVSSQDHDNHENLQKCLCPHGHGFIFTAFALIFKFLVRLPLKSIDA